MVCGEEGGGYVVGERSVQSKGKDCCPTFLQPGLEHVNRKFCSDGGRVLIPVFHNPHRKGGPFLPAMALTFGEPSGRALLGCLVWEGEKQIWNHIRYVPEYIE